MKKIYLVRHGITDGNLGNQYQLPSTPLAKQGIKDAKLLARRLKSLPIDVIISSHINRASETAKIIANKMNTVIVEDEIFQEIKRPSIVRGKSKNDPETKEIMRAVEANFGNPDWKHSDEENFFLLSERAKKALETILKREEDNILIVTHGAFLRMILGVMIYGDKLTPDIFQGVNHTFATSNTGVSIVEYEKQGWYVKTWNDHAHLGDLE
ncbi:MAG: histidine phosphatase family protein [Candidatus Paceibacterota bacterium]